MLENRFKSNSIVSCACEEHYKAEKLPDQLRYTIKKRAQALRNIQRLKNYRITPHGPYSATKNYFPKAAIISSAALYPEVTAPSR